MKCPLNMSGKNSIERPAIAAEKKDCLDLFPGTLTRSLCGQEKVPYPPEVGSSERGGFETRQRL